MEEGRDKRTTVFWRDNEVGWTRSDGGNIAFVLPINNSQVVVICASIEADIAELSDDEKQIFMAELNLTEPRLDRLIHAGYKLLNLETYFTAGVKEVRAWTVSKQATAPQAAGVIHANFEKGFIRAEVIAYDDFIKFNGEAGAKEAGKWRLEGKEYIVRDGDIMHFRFNV